MGKIITVKNNKGGVGKTFLSTQLAAGFALLEKKVLVLTSDAQNNVFDYTLSGFLKFKNGLKAEVLRGDGEHFRLRSNLYFLPLEDNKFSAIFLKKLPAFLKKCKKEYDYVIIDGAAALKVDDVFLDNSDSIIIPTYTDQVTMKSVINLLDEVDTSKVKAVVVNKFRGIKNEIKYYDYLKETLKDTGVLVPEPIYQVAFLDDMLDNKKTIWQYSNKTAQSIQKVIMQIMEASM